MLIFIAFQEYVSPRTRDDKIRVGASGLRAKPARSKRNIFLVLERDVGLLKILVENELLFLRERFAVASVSTAHVAQQ